MGQMAQAAIETTKVKDRTATRLDRRTWDTLISGFAAVVAVVMMAAGGAAIFGGSFALDNVRDELAPQNITFSDEMTPEEKAVAGEFEGQKVDTPAEAEAFAAYIGLHLKDMGMTYSEASGAARAYEAEVGENPTAAQSAELASKQGLMQTIFRGEMLRGTLLNAYAWGTVGTIVLYVGYGLVIAGLVLAVFAILGFRHARKIA